MNKLLILILVISMQFFIAGCELFEEGNPAQTSKELPCGSPALGKESTDKTMAQQDLLTTDLTAYDENEHKYVKAGNVTVTTECGSCIIDAKMLDCWEVLDMKVWIGKNLLDLKAIKANPEDFPDYSFSQMGNGLYRLVYPYQMDWYCNDNLNIAVWARVKNTCDELCGIEVVNGFIGEWDLRYGAGILGFGTKCGNLKVRVVNNVLKVEYDLDYPWAIKEANLEIEGRLSDVPASNDVPIPALFDYHHTGPYWSGNTFSIPLSVIKNHPGYYCWISNLFALTHAVIKKPGKEETAWGGSLRFSLGIGKWARYFFFSIPCGDERECEFESWAKGPSNQEFHDYPLHLFLKWGWYNKFNLLCN